MKKTVVFGFIVALASGVYADLYSGNGNIGFGDPIGSSTLDLMDDGFNLSITLTRGSGLLNDNFVIYLNTQSGGFSSNIGMNDEANSGRRAISGSNGGSDSDVTFGFDADYAISFDAVNGGFLFGLATGGDYSLNFIAPAGGVGTTTDAQYFLAVSLGDIGITPNSSSTINFVATYLDGSNAFMSDEGYGTGLPSGNPGNPSSVTFTGFKTYVTTIPEPSTAFMLGLGSLVCLRNRKLR